MAKKDKNIAIDFVIAWVDGNDKKWQSKRNKYASQSEDSNNVSRFRDWGLLKYWFRSIEENAPWVNSIYFVVDNQIPPFININHPKLKIVNHCDYIPQQFLPTFSSHTIEVNFHRIQGLSEFFVYFNDDMFLNNIVNKTFFFEKKLPRYSYIERKKNNITEGFMSCVVANDMEVVNKNVNRKEILKHPSKFLNYKYGKYGIKNIFLLKEKQFQRFEDDHLPCPFLKSTFVDLWNKDYDIFIKTSSNKFRTAEDVNQYVFKYFDMARGNFCPKTVKHGGYYLLDTSNIDSLVKDIIEGFNKMICLNDNSDLSDNDYCSIRNAIINAFEKRYPKKSSFEK